MNVGFRRFFAAFSLLALLSVIAAAPANAATPTGVGSSGGNVSVVSIDYGNIIKATLLGENNSDTIDPAVSVPTAIETLSPLTVHSVTLPALDAATVTPVQTTTTGALDQKSTSLLDLSSLGVPAITGAVNPATLSSLVDLNGAQSSLTSTLANVELAGLLNIDSASVNLGGVAGPTSSTASRAVSADAITVLDLQAILNLFGIELGDLTLGQLATLLDQLGLLDQVGLFVTPGDLVTAVTNDNAAVNAQQTVVNGLQTALTTAQANLTIAQSIFAAAVALCALNPATQVACITAAQSALAPVQVAFDDASAALAAAQAVLNILLAVLNGLLDNIADVLLSTPLLSVDGVQVGAVATARDTLANSSATVTGLINHIRLGGLDLGGFDANTTLTEISDLATNVTATINDILTTISPALDGLVTVKLLDRATQTFVNGDYVNAVAGITGLTATIDPADVCDVLDSLLFDELSLPLPDFGDPQLPGALADLGSIVNTIDCFPVAKSVDGLQPAVLQEGDVAALTGPLTLKAAAVNSASTFKVVAATETPATPESPALPRTGMNETLLLVIGGLMVAVALGLRGVASPARPRSKN